MQAELLELVVHDPVLFLFEGNPNEIVMAIRSAGQRDCALDHVMASRRDLESDLGFA